MEHIKKFNPLFKKFGLENFRMILIKEYEVCDRTHLQAYETLWVSKLTCVNKCIPLHIKKLSKKHYYETNKERSTTNNVKEQLVSVVENIHVRI